MDIQTVKLQGEGYLLDGYMSVPNAPGNRHYNAIQKWIAEGNTPEPEYTSSEQLEKDQAEVRAARDAKLRDEVDPYQGVLRYNELTQTQKNEIAQYRLDLLGVPQQAGFSTNPAGVVMPTKPEWV